ncbi:RNA-binding (LSM) protein, putative [Bodo saltans]|uniref:RNA-binding (LSM) protein, putative n=1 Tax=Bodo saltans TaxID=75058 RepID=A0A0S4INN2_BODSA|nr:RNA-binding (LSM) protein, putative [Bodo saltans]|eukprot:CUE83020.1 RNA-binding (LSM) protein, putative [Bodo saltans]
MPFLNMVTFLQQLRNETVEIELKNGSLVTGTVTGVDANMNTYLSNVKVVAKGKNTVTFPELTVRGGTIRYYKIGADFEKYLDRCTKKIQQQQQAASASSTA